MDPSKRSERCLEDGKSRLGKRKAPSFWRSLSILQRKIAEGDEGPVVIPVVVDIVEVELAVRVITNEVRRVEVARLRVTPKTHQSTCVAPPIPLSLEYSQDCILCAIPIA